MSYIKEITTDLNDYIDYLNYLYQATQNVLKFLLKNNVDENNNLFLKQYSEKAEKAFISLEQAKNYVAYLYLPDELKQKNFNFIFNFKNKTITYFED